MLFFVSPHYICSASLPENSTFSGKATTEVSQMTLAGMWPGQLLVSTVQLSTLQIVLQTARKSGKGLI